MNNIPEQIQKPSITIPTFRIYTCGHFLVERWDGSSYQIIPRGAWSSHSSRLLLKILLSSPQRRAQRRKLAEILWPGIDPEEAGRSLNDAAYRLRNTLRPAKDQESLFITKNVGLTSEVLTGSYALAGQAELWVDADAAFSLLAQAEAVEHQNGDALPLLEEAGSLLDRGEFLAGDQHPWIEGRCRTVADARHGCGLWRARLYEKRGEMHKAEFLLRLFLEENALDEDVLCALMLNLQQQGRIFEGLRLYEETRALLECRGMTPTEMTKTMWRQLRGDA